MEQNQNNYITLEMNLKLQMVCGARHNILYGKRWIMWTVLILRLIPTLWHAIAPHNPSNVIKPSEQAVTHREASVLSSGSDH